MRKQPTSLDVAKLAGVSQTTVSFVLNNRTDKVISESTRQRVLKAATDLRYRSNKLSNGILRGATKLLGVVIPSASDYYFGQVLAGISEQAHASGYQLLVSISSGLVSGVSEEDSIARLMEYRADGIICIAWDWDSTARQEWLNEVLSKHIPIVIVDDRTQWQRTDSIVTDDISGARLAVQHLIDNGYKRIVHFAGSDKLSTGKDRLAGYCDAMSDAKLPIDKSMIWNCEWMIDLAAEASECLLQMKELPDAVFAASDMMAGAMMAALTAKGLRCPDDVAIVGYGNTIMAEALNLTSIAQNPDAIGRRACDQLLKRVRDRDSAPELITLPVSLVKRGSTAKSRA